VASVEGRPAPVARQSSTPPGGGPEQTPRASPYWRGPLERVLALREGSIIVVTVITAIYFSLNTSTFLTTASFKTLLPYFAPFAILAAGEVFVMILGEIDLSIGAMYMSRRSSSTSSTPPGLAWWRR
jgi:simple sugar transport system permease protein